MSLWGTCFWVGLGEGPSAMPAPRPECPDEVLFSFLTFSTCSPWTEFSKLGCHSSNPHQQKQASSPGQLILSSQPGLLPSALFPRPRCREGFGFPSPSTCSQAAWERAQLLLHHHSFSLLEGNQGPPPQALAEVRDPEGHAWSQGQGRSGCMQEWQWQQGRAALLGTDCAIWSLLGLVLHLLRCASNQRKPIS